MKRQDPSFPRPKFGMAAGLFLLTSSSCFAQAVPYARNFAKPKEEVERKLQELEAYAGQKLPIVEGFVASGERPLERYDRAFYQYTIELLPGSPSGTTVRLTAKITAWYRDKDPAKSEYQLLPSNGRLELDLLDRLEEKLAGKAPQATARPVLLLPTPKVDSTGVPRVAVPAPGRSALPPAAESVDATGALRRERQAEEKQMKELSLELQSLEEIKKGQAHPLNLVVVKSGGTPVLAKPSEGSRVLFTSAANDEFEFLEGAGEWIHVQISGVSRGYIRRNKLELTDFVLARLGAPGASPASEAKEPFRIVREERGLFPGSWPPLNGKTVKLYTVQTAAEELKRSTGTQRLAFAKSLFQKFEAENAASSEHLAGVVVIFDSADGGIAAATEASLQELSSGTLTPELFWKQCDLDPPEAFDALGKR